MTQDIIVWALLMGLVGLIWVMALAVLGDNLDTHDKQEGNAQPEPHDGYEAHKGSSKQSRVAA
jgi:hypothetical protein